MPVIPNFEEESETDALIRNLQELYNRVGKLEETLDELVSIVADFAKQAAGR